MVPGAKTTTHAGRGNVAESLVPVGDGRKNGKENKTFFSLKHWSILRTMIGCGRYTVAAGAAPLELLS